MKKFIRKLFSRSEHKNRTFNGGFSLIELLAAILVFSIILIFVSSIFIQVVALQRRGSAAQKIQENTLLVLESMAREIRVSTIQSGNFSCTGAIGNYGTSLSIVHPVYGTVVYTMENGLIKRTENGINTYISSRDVNFSQFYFCVRGAGIDQQQARVAIVATVQNVTSNPRNQLTFHIQTTVSTRELSTEL